MLVCKIWITIYQISNKSRILNIYELYIWIFNDWLTTNRISMEHVLAVLLDLEK